MFTPDDSISKTCQTSLTTMKGKNVGERIDCKATLICHDVLCDQKHSKHDGAVNKALEKALLRRGHGWQKSQASQKQSTLLWESKLLSRTREKKRKESLFRKASRHICFTTWCPAWHGCLSVNAGRFLARNDNCKIFKATSYQGITKDISNGNEGFLLLFQSIS